MCHRVRDRPCPVLSYCRAKISQRTEACFYFCCVVYGSLLTGWLPSSLGMIDSDPGEDRNWSLLLWKRSCHGILVHGVLCSCCCLHEASLVDVQNAQGPLTKSAPIFKCCVWSCVWGQHTWPFSLPSFFLTHGIVGVTPATVDLDPQYGRHGHWQHSAIELCKTKWSIVTTCAHVLITT